jgi:uncharacterized membrane protein
MVFFALIIAVVHLSTGTAINIDKYTKLDFMTNVLSTCGSLVGLTFFSLSYKYAEASELSPLSTTQSIINFSAEFLFLHYDFGITDVIGTLVLCGAIIVPILGRKFDDKNVG